MYKTTKFSIYALTISSAFLIGCTNDITPENTSSIDSLNKSSISEESVNINEPEKNINANLADNIQTDNSTNNIENNMIEDSVTTTESSELNYSNQSPKQLYLEKLDQLSSYLKVSLEEKYNSPVSQDLLNAANEEYTEWDSMLNEIYSQLKTQLSTSDMETLTSNQIKWLDTRDLNSRLAGETTDGSISPLLSIMSLIESTKSRCYELINNYM